MWPVGWTRTQRHLSQHSIHSFLYHMFAFLLILYVFSFSYLSLLRGTHDKRWSYLLHFLISIHWFHKKRDFIFCVYMHVLYSYKSSDLKPIKLKSVNSSFLPTDSQVSVHIVSVWTKKFRNRAGSWSAKKWETILIFVKWFAFM
jgi:hypothetical protein